MAVERHDTPRPTGLFRELRYSDRDVAVFEASPTVITVNWTTSVSSVQFVEVVEKLTDISDAGISLDLKHVLSEPDVPQLRRMIGEDGFGFDDACAFVRMDLSYTRSVAWQRLTDDGLVVVGFGDSTTQISQSDDTLAANLLQRTATKPVDVDEVSRSLSQLANRFHKPFGRGAGS